ncbi:MAG: phospholipid carrier-dependent glycosyltransferase [Planctomycetota bacterium]|jgi:hypothetical protein
MRSTISTAVLVVTILAVAAAFVQQAFSTPLRPFDEPLWFHRSLVTPASVDTPERRHWAIDIPGLSRWVHWAVLKTTDLDRIPPSEPPCWDIRDGRVYFKGEPTDSFWGRKPGRTLEQWEARHGRYAPRKGLMAMRMTNLAFFFLAVGSLYYTAWLVLGRKWLSALAVVPVLASPVFATDVAFLSRSGDVFLVAAFAAGLAAWTRFHLSGRGTSTAAIAVMGIVAGLAVSAKHPGVLLVAAYGGYLVWLSPGWSRLVNPLALMLVAFGVFGLLNPGIFLGAGGNPFAACLMMIERRAINVAHHLRYSGAMSFTQVFGFFWWPLFPAFAYLLWACRRERWFPAVGTWAAVITAAMLIGLFTVRLSFPSYFAPLELSLYFPLSLAALSLAARCGAAEAVTERASGRTGV